MNKCEVCGFENRDDKLVCDSCGYKMFEIDDETNKNEGGKKIKWI